MNSCPICGTVDAPSIQKLLQHIGLKHRYDPRFSITCGLSGCPKTYLNFFTFRSHVYKSHKGLVFGDKACAHGLNLQNCSHVSICCPMCKTTIPDIRQLSSHLHLHIDQGEKIECPYDSCGRLTYDVYSSLTSHISRKHKKANACMLSSKWISKVKNNCLVYSVFL